MSDERINKMIILKSKLQNALDLDNYEDVKKYYGEYKTLFKEVTSQDFESTIPASSLEKIRFIINN